MKKSNVSRNDATALKIIITTAAAAKTKQKTKWINRIEILYIVWMNENAAEIDSTKEKQNKKSITSFESWEDWKCWEQVVGHWEMYACACMCVNVSCFSLSRSLLDSIIISTSITLILCY